MVLLDKMWDDVLAGPQPERGLGKLRKMATQPLSIKDEGEGKRFQRSLSMPTSPLTPTPRKENMWRSVFHPATKSIGADMFDRPPPQPNSPTVYDCDQTEALRQRRKENMALCLALQWGDSDKEQAWVNGWQLKARGTGGRVWVGLHVNSVKFPIPAVTKAKGAWFV
ncbi:hypothetical protein V6N11_053600 [Hibiscus sabdariffa]|uniref:Uncharacterized protein n=1 Tax=Hibiscus sabdariffa TaxID=183260 RepID=A0ABR2UDQ5_9ROSI